MKPQAYSTITKIVIELEKLTDDGLVEFHEFDIKSTLIVNILTIKSFERVINRIITLM